MILIEEESQDYYCAYCNVPNFQRFYKSHNFRHKPCMDDLSSKMDRASLAICFDRLHDEVSSRNKRDIAF